MALSEIVSVSIQAGTVSPARRGFGVPLLMSYHTEWAGAEVRSYSTQSGVQEDFAADSMQAKWSAAMFQQRPRPPSVKIGRLPEPATGHSTVLDFADMASGSDIAGSVVAADGTTTTIDVAWDNNLATTLGALETALELVSGVASATVSSSTVTVVGDTDAGVISFEITTPGVHVRDTTADWDYDDALSAALLIDEDFYVVFADCNSPKNMDKIARWAAANDRFAVFGPQYTKPSQFVAGEFTLTADHTALLANDSAAILFRKSPRRAFDEASWAGALLPLAPGSATWAFKSPVGVGADNYTTTERNTIDTTNHGNYVQSLRRVAITRPGKTTGGEWIDVVIGLAWLESRLQERFLAALANNPKIPYTDAGFAILVAECRAQLQEAERAGVLDSGWEVTILPVADQSSADRADRIVRGLEFSARLAGAVHTINIVGTVTA